MGFVAGRTVAGLPELSATLTVVTVLSAALLFDVLVIVPTFVADVSATGFIAFGAVVSAGKVPGTTGLLFAVSGGVLCADAAPTIPRRRKENNSFFID